MSIHFQQLHADVFEDRAMPSVSFLTIPAGYFSSATVRIADQGLVSTPRPFTQATAMRFNDQGFGLVPLWMNENGGATYLIVNLRSAPPAEQSVTFGPVSQRLSAGATAETATAAADETVQQTVREATTQTPQPTTTPVSYNPEQATRAATLPNAPRQQEAAPRIAEPNTPVVFANPTPSTPLLRDYSTSAVTEEAPRVLPEERLPTPENVAPPVTPPMVTPPSEPATLTVDELTVTPLAGMLPFNVADLEKETANLLQRVANFGEDLAEEISASSEYVWLTAAALVAGGAVLAARSTRPLQPVYATNGPLAAWKDKHDGQRG